MFSEQQIIHLLHQQDKRAIAILYDQYASSLFGVICRIVKSEDIAKDVLQDTFIKIWKSGKSYNQRKGKLFTWLLKIARNTAIDTIRSAYYKHHVLNNKQFESYDLEQKSNEETEVEDVGMKEILCKLDWKYKQVIDLIYFSGYTQAETAEALDIPLGTVKTRVKIGLRELRKLFCQVVTFIQLLILAFV